ncbi:MAG: FAD-dependent monooxygenase [Pseudonocardiaceae bacterium]
MFITDVLVVGAGPATAVTALRHGARVLVVERHAGMSTVPRATGVSIRTMELFRFWGVAEAVRAGSVDCDPTVAVIRTLAEEPQEIVPLAYPSLRDTLAASPALPVLCPQDHIEPVLVAEVRCWVGVVSNRTTSRANGSNKPCLIGVTRFSLNPSLADYVRDKSAILTDNQDHYTHSHKTERCLAFGPCNPGSAHS